jgi:hypothetical protein
MLREKYAFFKATAKMMGVPIASSYEAATEEVLAGEPLRHDARSVSQTLRKRSPAALEP